MAGPIEDLIQDAVNVVKASFRAFINDRMPHRFANADAVRAANLANVNLIYVSPRLYEKDTSDDTSADDGTTLIRDTNGIAFKHVAVGIAVTSLEGVWSNAAMYGKGALVSHGGLLFISRIDGNLNNDPDDTTPGDTTQWMLVPTIAGATVTGTSTTSLTIGTGSKVFATQEGIGWVIGSRLRAAASASTSNYIEGRATAYSGTSLTITVDKVGGSGTHADWNIGLAGDVGAAGADLGLPFDFDSGTADADPGTGEFRVNNASLASATEIYISETDANGADVSSEIAAWDDSTSTTAKGILEIRKRDDAAAFVRYTITSAITDQGVYDKFTIVHRASAGTLTAGDRCQILFSEKGDKGADGAGSGDFSGPASATDEAFVRFDTATGKQGQNSVVTADDTGNVSGVNSLTINEITEPTTPASGKGIIYAKSDGKAYFKNDGGTETDLTAAGGSSGPTWEFVAKLAMQLAATSNSPIDFVGEIADSYEDSAGMDTGGSTNLDTSETGVIKPSTATGTDQIPTMTSATTSGVTMSASSEFSATFAAWKAGDKNNGTHWVANASLPQWIKVDLGSAKTIVTYTIRARSDSTSEVPNAWTLEGSNNDSDWTTIDTRSGVTSWTTSEEKSFTVNSPGSYRYYRINISAAASTTNASIAELTLVEMGATNNMTAISAAFTLPAEPNTVDIYGVREDVDSITINTDLDIEVSIDGGTTWATGTISDIETAGSKTVFKAENIDVTSQTGTSFKYRYVTTNNKMVEIQETFARTF